MTAISQPVEHPVDSQGHATGATGEADALIVLKVQAGDAAAFDQLVERYKTRLYAVIYNILGNHEDAADLSQEAFVKAFTSIHNFRRQSSFYVWLYRIGINMTLNFLKLRKEAHLSLNELDPITEEEFVSVELISKENPLRDVNSDELQKKLNESLQKLSKDQRAVVVLHDIEGMRHQEIAKVLGCSEATARSRLFYAHQQLQTLLAKYL